MYESVYIYCIYIYICSGCGSFDACYQALCLATGQRCLNIITNQKNRFLERLDNSEASLKALHGTWWGGKPLWFWYWRRLLSAVWTSVLASCVHVLQQCKFFFFYSHFCLALKLLQWHTAVMSIPPMMWRMNLSGSLDSGVLLACNFVSAWVTVLRCGSRATFFEFRLGWILYKITVGEFFRGKGRQRLP